MGLASRDWAWFTAEGISLATPSPEAAAVGPEQLLSGSVESQHCWAPIVIIVVDKGYVHVKVVMMNRLEYRARRVLYNRPLW